MSSRIMDKDSNNKVANKVVNKVNKSKEIKMDKTKTDKTNNSLDKPKTVNKVNKVTRPTSNKASS